MICHLNFTIYDAGIGPERAALLSISQEARKRKRLARGISLESPNGHAGGWVAPDSDQTNSTTQTEAAMIQKIAYT